MSDQSNTKKSNVPTCYFHKIYFCFNKDMHHKSLRNCPECILVNFFLIITIIITILTLKRVKKH